MSRLRGRGLVETHRDREMATPAWLESSLRRSASLGLEVLQRASRRSVDWSGCSNPSQTPTDPHGSNEEDFTHTTLENAFESIAEFMAETTHRCKNFYRSDPAAGPNDNERTHICRYHSQTRQRPGTAPTRKHARSEPEDFHIEVSPGTYAITAGMPDCQQQTRLVSITAGESVNLTFDL